MHYTHILKVFTDKMVIMSLKQLESRDRVIVAPATKNSTSNNHTKDILHDKNHFYGIALVHITSNVARKHFQMAGYLEIVKT